MAPWCIGMSQLWQLSQPCTADRTKGIAPRLLPWLVAANPVNFGALSFSRSHLSSAGIETCRRMACSHSSVLQRPVMNDTLCIVFLQAFHHCSAGKPTQLSCVEAMLAALYI